MEQQLQITKGATDAIDELNYCFKEATTLGQLLSLTALTKLNVAFNALSNLQGIDSLQNLQHLNVSHNRLSSIEHVSALPGLTQLVCGYNKIRSVKPVSGLPSLQFLALHSNRISSPAEVLLLSHLTRLKHLTLCDNPVCKQDGWQHAAITALPSLQALDSTVITPEERATAAASASTWSAGQLEYDSSTPSDVSCAASDDGNGGDHGSSSSSTSYASGSNMQLNCSYMGRRSSSAGSAGRLRPRVQQPLGTVVHDSTSIKDATSLLPSMSLQPLKPSSLMRRPAEEPKASLYGYTRAKPVTTLQRQIYAGSDRAAVVISSDGSANLTWPEGSMAATLTTEDPPAAGSSASGLSNGSTSLSGSVAPIKGCRLLAMYRTVTGVAASFDSGGGFAQWPNGQLMLVWDKRNGTVYSPDGHVTHRFANKRKPPGALIEDITADLDDHLSIKFLAGSHDVQLCFSCEGCEAVLSQQHGAVLPDRTASVDQQRALHSAPVAASHQAVATSSQQLDDARDAAVSAAVASLPGGDEMQALLSRARALMAATDLAASEEQANNEPLGPTAAATAAVDACVAQPAGHGKQSSVLSGFPVGASSTQDDVNDELQAMMARARAAVAATAVSLQGLGL